MNNELHQFLTDNFTKRYTENGKEVTIESMPKEICTSDKPSIRLYTRYHSATPLIKLPTFEVFIDYLDTAEMEKEYDTFTIVRELIFAYKDFIKTLRTLPCKDGKVLEEPDVNNYDGKDVRNVDYDQDCIKYQAAKDRVMFEGWHFVCDCNFVNGENGSSLISNGDQEFMIDKTQNKTISDAIELGLFIKPIK